MHRWRGCVSEVGQMLVWVTEVYKTLVWAVKDGVGSVGGVGP